MKPQVAIIAVLLHGVVDQIDTGVASIEWVTPQGPEFSFVPTALLPEHVAEGDPIVLRLRRRRGVPLPDELAQSLPIPIPFPDPLVQVTPRKST